MYKYDTAHHQYLGPSVYLVRANKQKHPSSHMHKYCSLTAFDIHYIRIPNYTLLPIIIISHRSINFEQKCRRVVLLSIDELSQKNCQQIVLSMSCLDSGECFSRKLAEIDLSVFLINKIMSTVLYQRFSSEQYYPFKRLPNAPNAVILLI